METKTAMKYQRVKCCNRRYLLVLFLASVIVVCYLRSDYNYLLINPAMEELNFYTETMQKQCSETSYKLSSSKQPQKTLPESFQKPECQSLLSNISRGKWVTAPDLNRNLKLELDDFHNKFRTKAGISRTPWKSNGECGYKVLSEKITPFWPETGSFCDPQGPNPCCSHIWNGKCVPITAENKCDCENCVDTIRYNTDALLSEWKTADERCKWEKYSAGDACSVLNKLSNENSTAHLYFVGDSLMRNMFMGLSSILVDNLERGIYKKCVSKELRELCRGDNLFIQRPCHDLSVAYSLDDIAGEPGMICNGNRRFAAEYKGIGLPVDAEKFIQLMEEINGRENTYVIIGVGLHFQCKHQDVIDKYFKPVLPNKPSWPRLLWVQPNSVGLLKPPAYMSTQGNDAINIFAQHMEAYFKKLKIPVLDFRQITTGVASYDGTHYGSGVNMMKNQVLLNYFASLNDFNKNSR